MAIEALWFGAPTSHSAMLARRLTATLLTPGVAGPISAFAPGELAVTANGVPNMTVKVAPGKAVVAGSHAANVGGSYLFYSDAIETVVIDAASGVNPRRDLIVAQINDADGGGVGYTGTVEVVTGTPAGAPVDPAVPDNCLVLARVAVATSAASIGAANITDLRAKTSGVGSPVAPQRVAIGDQTWPAAGTIRTLGSLTTPAAPFGEAVPYTVALRGSILLGATGMVASDGIDLTVYDPTSATYLAAARGVYPYTPTIVVDHAIYTVADGLARTFELRAQRVGGTGGIHVQGAGVSGGFSFLTADVYPA